MTTAEFHILLTLVDAPLHGYAIMQEVEDRSDGSFVLGPGTLYRSLKRLVAEGHIHEVADDEDDRRRSYAILPDGRAAVREEALRMRAWTDEAAQKGLIEP